MSLDNLATRDALFQKILSKELKNETIKDVVLTNKEAATKKGDNFMSCLTRFTLKYTSDVERKKKEKFVHLMMKEEPIVSESILDHIRELNIFKRERKMLECVIPKIEKLIGKRLGPKVYYCSSTPVIIVMEDLAALGFKNKFRELGFDKNEILLVLENLADFHAGSVFLKEEDPGYASDFNDGLFGDKVPEAFKNITKQTLIMIADGISSWEDRRFKKIADKIRRMSEKFLENLNKTYQVDEDEFSVLNHGDLWINNIMLKEGENGGIQEARVVDYQMSVWSSPAIDLHYFLGINPELSIKFDHDDIFLEAYLTRLTRTMKTIGCVTEAPTMEELKKSFHKRRIYGVMSSLVFYPKVVAEEKNMETLDNMLQQGKTTMDIMNNPMVEVTLKKILPIMDDRRYFD